MKQRETAGSAGLPRPGQLALLVAGTFTALALIHSLIAPGTLVADLRYYHSWLTFDGGGHFDTALREYPLPAVLTLAIPTAFTTSVDGYIAAYVCAMLALLFAWLVAAWRYGGPRVAVVTAVLIVAIGPITLFRFDLIPALFVGAALLALPAFATVFAVLVACGTAMKL